MRNNTKKTGECICDNCGVTFNKPLTEIRRSEKNKRKHFCSRTCVGKNNSKNFGDRASNYRISQHSNNRMDGFTKFRYHYRNILKRDKEVTVTLDDLKEMWDEQQGICPFTKINLTLSSYTKISKNPIYTASLDRIDSTKGYIKGNIRWISRAINWMKNDMNDDMVFELIDILIKNKKDT